MLNGRADGVLGGKIDPSRIAVAGHSDGAETALAVAYDHRYRDRRIACGDRALGRGASGDGPVPAERAAAARGAGNGRHDQFAGDDRGLLRARAAPEVPPVAAGSVAPPAVHGSAAAARNRRARHRRVSRPLLEGSPAPRASTRRRSVRVLTRLIWPTPKNRLSASLLTSLDQGSSRGSLTDRPDPLPAVMPRVRSGRRAELRAQACDGVGDGGALLGVARPPAAVAGRLLVHDDDAPALEPAARRAQRRVAAELTTATGWWTRSSTSTTAEGSEEGRPAAEDACRRSGLVRRTATAARARAQPCGLVRGSSRSSRIPLPGEGVWTPTGPLDRRAPAGAR